MICAANPAYPHFRGSGSAGDDFIDFISLKNCITFVISAGDYEGHWQSCHKFEVDVDKHPGELLWSLGIMNETCERPWRSSPPAFPRPSSSCWHPSRYVTLFRTITFSPIMTLWSNYEWWPHHSPGQRRLGSGEQGQTLREARPPLRVSLPLWTRTWRCWQVTVFAMWTMVIIIVYGIGDKFSFKTYDLHHFFNNIMIPSCYYNSCNRVSLLRNLHIYLHYGQKWGLMSHDHHNLHNHHPLSSGQGWTGCGGATGGFSKNSARRKGICFSKSSPTVSDNWPRPNAWVVVLVSQWLYAN